MEIHHNYFNTTESTAILITQSAKINITSNIFKNNINAINHGQETTNVMINQNYFQMNTWAVECFKNATSEVSYLNNSITNNYFENNSIAIVISGGNFGVIQDNIMLDLSFKYEGIELQRSINTLVKGNYLSGFNIGLELSQLSDFIGITSECNSAVPECSELGNTSSTYYTLHESNVTVTGNEFKSQYQTSILIHNYTDGNSFYDNDFVKPTINLSQPQVRVGLEQNTTNNFSKNGLGNYWTNYNGTDANNDGIGDSPFTINQNISDPDPLMNPINFIYPIPTIFNESSFLTRIQIGISGGTTAEIVPTFPVQPVQTTGTSTTVNSVTDSALLNNFLNFMTTGFINIFSIISFASIALISLLVVNEYRKYSKTNVIESFWNHLIKKFRRKRKRKQQPLQLSESVFDELQEIINENASKK